MRVLFSLVLACLGSLTLLGAGCSSDDSGGAAGASGSAGSAGAPGATKAVSIAFAAQVAGKAFACGQSYTGVGSTGATVKPLDFRMYVHDVQLVRANGEAVPVTLAQDGTWQNGSVALLDFEDGSADCTEGDPDTRTVITGTVADHDDYDHVTFKLGLPAERNHLDSSSAPPPLNIPALWWAWQAGFKYMKLDLSTEKNPSYFLHLGARGCDGSPAAGFSCQYENIPSFTLAYSSSSTVVLDVASLYAGVDLNAVNDAATDPIPGCMSFDGDPQCGVVFEHLGLQFDSGLPTTQSQTFVTTAGTN